MNKGLEVLKEDDPEDTDSMKSSFTIRQELNRPTDKSSVGITKKRALLLAKERSNFGSANQTLLIASAKGPIFS